MLAGIPVVLKAEPRKRLIGTGIGTNVPKIFLIFDNRAM